MSDLTEFKMPFLGSCAVGGELIQQNEPVYAVDMNAVTAGQGICKACYTKATKGKKGGAGENVETEHLQPQADKKSKGFG
jgi:hypothetical protein